jgi:hypothetical protein
MTEHLHELARRKTPGLPVVRWSTSLQRRDAAGRLPDRRACYLGFDPSDISRYATEKGYEVERALYGHEHSAAPPGPEGEGPDQHRDVYDLEPAAFVADAAQTLAEKVFGSSSPLPDDDARAQSARRSSTSTSSTTRWPFERLPETPGWKLSGRYE